MTTHTATRPTTTVADRRRRPAAATTRPHVPLTLWLCPPDQQPADRLPPPLLARIATGCARRRPSTGQLLPPLIRTIGSPDDLEQLPGWIAQLPPSRLLATVSRNTHDPVAGLVDLAGLTVRAAQAAGLHYLQHLVLAPHPTAHAESDPREPGTVRSLGPHTDLLLFTHPGAAR